MCDCGVLTFILYAVIGIEDYINIDEEKLLDDQKFTDQNACEHCVIDENSV